MYKFAKSGKNSVRIFNRRQPSMDEDLQWKNTFAARQPLMDDEVPWKTNFDE